MAAIARLQIDELLPKAEICHYFDGRLRITTRFRDLWCEGVANTHVKIPSSEKLNFLGFSRLFRRALRFDKCNVVPVGENLVILRQGSVYLYESSSQKFLKTLDLLNCRNALHQAVLKAPDGSLYFGEYGNNSERRPVNLYRSTDAGYSWKTIYQFPEKSIKHIHGVYWDDFERKIWVFTGDFAGENLVLAANSDFSKIEKLGDGGQSFRACNAFFAKEAVYWIMDSPLETSHLIRLDRKTRTIEKLQSFPGPVWYIKELTDGYYVAATAVEPGPSVKDQFAHLFISKNLRDWDEIHRFPHDGLPKGYFKFGVVGFAEGPQSSQEFYIFGEALKGLEGRVARCHLEF